jgi:hypothetical protein
MKKLDEPLNANERYLYGIIERLDLIIEMFTPKEVIASVEVKPVKTARKKKEMV